MSRAINIAATQDHVLATCAKKNIPISAIEPLQSGGTRVVFNNADDTALITKAYGAKVLKGPVQRVPTRMSRY
jgi:diketogulonate reductase-like aldo/keto reductase